MEHNPTIVYRRSLLIQHGKFDVPVNNIFSKMTNTFPQSCISV